MGCEWDSGRVAVLVRGGRELFRIQEGGYWEHNFSWSGQFGENGAEWGSGRATVWGKGWGKLMRMLMNLWGAWS